MNAARTSWIISVPLCVGLLFICASLSTCNPDLDCEVTGCTTPLTCDEDSGECVTPTSGCQPGSCPDGQTCNRDTGECERQRRECGSTPCEFGECNSRTGYCETVSRCEAGDCPSAAERCDDISGECVRKRCQVDSECPTGFICSRQEKICIEGCRPDEPDCPEETFCATSREEDQTGNCISPCQTDEECPFGQYCDETRTPQRCALEPPCNDRSDCRPKEECINGRCGLLECRTQEDCQDSAICDQRRYRCVEPECEEDIFSPNHSYQRAFPIAPGTYTNLVSCPGKSDWFSIDAEPGDYLTIELSHGDSVDLDMSLVGQNGELIRANQQIGTRAYIDYINTREQTLRLKITAAQLVTESNSAEYNIDIQRNAQGNFCEDDPLEENDTPSEATVLANTTGFPNNLNLQICGTDEDWLKLESLRATDGLELSSIERPPRIEISLFTPDGQTYRVQPSAESFRLYRLGADGDYFIRAKSERRKSGSYNLDITRLPNYDCPDPQGQSSADQAEPLNRNEITESQLCPLGNQWEIDWYRLVLERPINTETLKVRVRPAASLPPLQIDLLEREGSNIDLLRPASKVDENLFEATINPSNLAPSSDLFVRILSNASPGRLTAKPTYEVSFR